MGGERKMPQVVGADLQFKAVCRGASWWDHHPSIVDEDVEMGCTRHEGSGCLFHRIQICKVEVQGSDICFRILSLDSGGCISGFRLVAACKNDLSPFSSEFLCHLQPDAGVGAGDENDLVVLWFGVGKAPFQADSFSHDVPSFTADFDLTVSRTTGRYR